MNMRQSARQRIIVPLDVSTEEEALSFVKQLGDYVGFFKVGLELINSVGLQILQKVRDLGGKVFYDCKLKDIPNTVAGAARGITRWKVDMFNVQADGGLEMMKAALEASDKEASTMGVERPKILGVTVLTSINKRIMNEELGILGEVEDIVVQLAKLIDRAGLDGIIASAHEIEKIRQVVSKQLLIVTPGIRPVWAVAHDQRRVMTPGEAILRGASYLVIGRPITQPPKEIGGPVDAAKRIAEEMAIALDKTGR